MESREVSPVSERSSDSDDFLRRRSRSLSRSGSRSRSVSRDRSVSRSRSPVIRGPRDRRGDRSPRLEEALAEVAPLPAPGGRIPRRDAFVNAVENVPPAPQLNSNSLRTRVALSEDQKAIFNSLAAGNEMIASERSALFKELPLPASVLALPPVLEDAMKSALKDFRRSPESVVLGGNDLHALHELLLNVLNVSEVVLKLGADDAGAPFGGQVVDYLNILRRLLSAGIRDVTLWGRESVLRSVGLSRSRLPVIGAAPIEDASIVHRISNELRPPLFGTELRSELTASDSSLSKGINTLVKSGSSGRTSNNNTPYSQPRKRSNGGGSRDEGGHHVKFPRSDNQRRNTNASQSRNGHRMRKTINTRGSEGGRQGGGAAKNNKNR